MNEALLRRARETKFYQDGLRELGRHLPVDDQELDRVLGEAAAGKDDRAFTHLIFAALGGGRAVDARHLIEGAVLFPGLKAFACAALHCSGNVTQALMKAVERGGFPPLAEEGVLAVAAAWCEYHPGEPIPAELISRARLKARGLAPDDLPAMELISIARRTQDPGLRSILEKSGHWKLRDWTDPIVESIFDAGKASPLAHVPTEPEALAISGYTVRRSAPRIGRNDPCPCGSGKKYKKCCYNKDQERLLHPSAVPGLTVDEWRDAPELGLTRTRLLQMRGFELARLDPLKIPENLRWLFLNELLTCDQLEPAVSGLEKLGFNRDNELAWHRGLRTATQAGRKDLIQRLLGLRTDLDKEKDIQLSTRLLLADESGHQSLDLIEKHARAALQTGKTAPVAELAYSMLESRAPSLGILLTWGVLPIAPELESITLFDEVLQARDRLQLPPDDPYDQILDARLIGSPDVTGAVSKELEAARAGLEAKSQEVRQLAQELQRLHRDLERREASKPNPVAAPPAQSAPRPAPAEAPPARDEEALAQMRQRIDSLREMLKERHKERNQLRHELQTAHAQIEKLHEKKPSAPASPTAAAAASEDDLLLADEEFSSQPVRLPEFPKKFLETMESLPKSIARICLGLIGRMAGGEPAAFAGSKRLKMVPGVYRQRLGGDYRLLFRLYPARLEIIDLIHRRDLERKIKTLM